MSRIRHWCAASIVVLAASSAAFGESADEAMRKVISDLGDGNVAAVWDAMPASYQADLSYVLHTGAEKIDPAVWKKGFELANKLVAVMKAKKQMVLSSQMMAQNPEPEKVEAGYDATVAVLSILANSEISKLENVKKLDIRKFMAGTGSKLVKKVMAASEELGDGPAAKDLKNAKVTLVSSGEGVATLSIEMPGEPAKTDQFVQVEGKWIPQEMAAGWAENMPEVKAHVEAMERDPEQAQQTLMMLQGMIGQLDMLAKVETQEQFDQMMGMLFMGVMMQVQAHQARSQQTE